ncbi:arginine decarboxylase, pyruvoyl-dependent [Candidatus Micrarchaeota archaeon]|nr:arginine decarboxylase, pyruvoyl-dependent [Candidatus Micrarchaeota archaeon]
MYVPKKVFFTKGKGTALTKLGSFEAALKDAGIARFNIVEVSSIFPPNAGIVTPEETLAGMKSGAIVHMVLAKMGSNEPGRIITSAIGCALPKNKNHHGYLSEFHEYGIIEKKAAKAAEDLAREMLLKTGEKQKDIERTFSTVISTKTSMKGKWTTVVSAAVLI